MYICFDDIYDSSTVTCYFNNWRYKRKVLLYVAGIDFNLNLLIKHLVEERC